MPNVVSSNCQCRPDLDSDSVHCNEKQQHVPFGCHLNSFIQSCYAFDQKMLVTIVPGYQQLKDGLCFHSEDSVSCSLQNRSGTSVDVIYNLLRLWAQLLCK